MSEREPEPELEPEPEAPPPPLEIVYQSETVVAVNKPSGMLVHRGWAQDDVVAVDLLHAQLGRRVWPIHRLDRGTSGVLVFALDVDTARSLNAAFEQGRVAKRYLALVRGHPPAEQLIDYSLRRVDHKSKDRQEAQTRVVVRERVTVADTPRGGHYALVEACPQTGRTHQIRRHLKHAAHPIIGDVRYGKGEHNRLFRTRFGLHRLALHALELRVTGLGEDALELHLQAPMPAELVDSLRAIGFTL